MRADKIYRPKNHIRVATAASLFDGHDASINVMRRILQASGAEVIHLGHNRSVAEIVACAVQEDVQAVAVTSYQGGHMESFKYMRDMLKAHGCGHIRVFGGGGGVILPSEIQELQDYGIARIYSPDDGRRMGLQGMVNDILKAADFPAGNDADLSAERVNSGDFRAVAAAISAAENYPERSRGFLGKLVQKAAGGNIPVIGFTGTGGSGKSSLVDEIIRRYLADFPDKNIAALFVDPSKRKSGGALLGDRIRMNSASSPRVYMRSMATRQSNRALSKHVKDAICVFKAAGFDAIILESSGIGQSDTEIVDHSDISVYVMTPEYGAATQLEKIDMLDFADVVAINKFEKKGALDALRDVRKQYARSRRSEHAKPEALPIFGTVASQFNDEGVDNFYSGLMQKVAEKTGGGFKGKPGKSRVMHEKILIIPPHRARYLSEIADTVRDYNKRAGEQADIAQRLYAIRETVKALEGNAADAPVLKRLENAYGETEKRLEEHNRKALERWDKKRESYKKEFFTFHVRDKEIKIKTHTESLSRLQIPKISLPGYKAWGDILKWSLKENVPGEFPYAAGVFPFKREGEDPTRMFAGEGGPERTNKRFHYVSKGSPARRLSTAFDSVTLYGADPAIRPDIYGKIGNSGVSVACLDDAKKLYSGFNLADPMTSVSMTINGPAPIMTAYFMNAAIDQQCELYIRARGLEKKTLRKIGQAYKKGMIRPAYHGRLPEGNDGLGLLLLGVTGDQALPRAVYETIKAETMAKVRGTVQSDILKEDQAQNTCIYSIDFSLKLMGDVQDYFINHGVRNFYSVSISGYHIAEAGANPITQLAFTLANGFTYVEYYASRGMDIDKFAPNLSFFFSNGMEPEFSVMGRVARIIWAKAMKFKYKANSLSQKLKYHIQTSGRSLHAQEIDFNDIRTTLQALYAVYDNCNSLHTNACDEAITTPTEDSVRRAMAVQLIINRELGLANNQNPLQGAFIIEELTELVEEAVMAEFDRLNERGGALGAMETMYQRSKIQEESLYYETMKHDGTLPLVGVNTFLSSRGSPTVTPGEVIRSTEQEKMRQISALGVLHKTYVRQASAALNELKKNAASGVNLFESLMETAKYCSLGQITDALFEIGGQYRRSM